MAQMSIDGELVKQSRLHSFCLQPLCQSTVPECDDLQRERRVQTREDVWCLKSQDQAVRHVYSKLPAMFIFVLSFLLH